jgi:hypothetical protein
MKIYIIIFLFLLSAGLAFTKADDEIKWIYNEKCKVIFKDSTALSGYILEKKDNVVKFLKLDDTETELKTSDIINVISLLRYRFGSVGIGIGPSYGFLGINAEFEFLNYFGAYGGIGIIANNQMGYAAGLSFYFKSKESTFRPRILVQYGTNIVTYYYYEDEAIGEGINVGFGITLNFGKKFVTGTDISLQIPVWSTEKLNERTFPVSIYSIGFRIYF